MMSNRPAFRFLLANPARHVALLGIVACLVSIPASAQWVAQGPGPNTLGQVENITDGEVVGAINVLAAHPSIANILYVGAVNGGIWKTTDATSASPSWVHQTDGRRSLSMASLAFDPTDGTSQTLLAGIGRSSSFGGVGGFRTGLLRTTDGGATWTPITGVMEGRNINGVAPRGATLVAAVNVADNFTCSNIGIWRSTDTGATWSQITSGIPRGSADVLASHPSTDSILYTSITFAPACDSDVNGIYRSADTGASWTKVSSAAMDALLTDSTATNVKIAVGSGGHVFVAIAPSTTGQLGGVFRSPDGMGSWTAMDLPTTFEDTANVGIHPGQQASIHMSLAADPTDSDIVYVGGDRQPLTFNDTFTFPNSIGARDFSGRLFRGDAGLAPGSQWTPLTHSGTGSNSSPHADSRDMAFDAAGTLLEVDDGGVYKRTSPRTDTGDWLSINGDIQTTELHDVSYDRISDILIGGAQDTGTPQQITPGGATWASVSTADGGDVAVDVTSTPGMSNRYSSFQNLGAFRKRTYDASNVLQATTSPALNVVSGSGLAVQFVTPVVVNAVDGDRLIIGGGNSVYESTDQGATLTEIGPGIVVVSPGRNIAYGASGNADVLYVGACVGSCTAGGDDGVFVRSTGGGSLTRVVGASASDVIRGVAVDPSDPAHAFAVDSSVVRRTSNTGGSWTDVTTNLAAYDTGALRSIAYAERAGGDVVVVGADRGVYFAEATTGFTYWINISHGLPQAPVFELDHDPVTNTLTVGTMGRGAWKRAPSLGDFVFADGFESGNVTAWTTSFP